MTLGLEIKKNQSHIYQVLYNKEVIGFFHRDEDGRLGHARVLFDGHPYNLSLDSSSRSEMAEAILEEYKKRKKENSLGNNVLKLFSKLFKK